ncbi:PREDICTED: S-adenosylmethionine decarboxylase proenzyme-like [Priapulus caudatus]|uniref:adenosylmethionine decarboxylase n=1 Tax=Priapulus caudatus TaxID=37621 RepID=A0ABM1EJP7_PRICU|nr:PREDICTED: S-adenosylmethionine decarboxylase proenzyme-like [Priapulus caudatus]
MVDSYVLSESSMFVLKHRLILKTCGRTTLLDAIKPLRELADKHCGFNKVQDIFYSHKNLMRPHMQEEPHKCFAKEVEILDELFDNGEAYCLGKVNSDCWYLYTLNQFCDPILVPDQTLEVLMTKLDPEVMKMFTCEESSTAREITEKTGIGMLWPNMKIDDFLFDPCGYSMNGVFDEDKYMTIHVTPEDEFSYVSFETNASERCYKRMIGDVLQIFHPGKFILTVFANKHSVADISCTTHTEYKFSNYRKDAAQHVHFENYDLRYLSFQKAPS